MEISQIILNKKDVEEGISQELINISNSRSIFGQTKSNNGASCEALRQLS